MVCVVWEVLTIEGDVIPGWLYLQDRCHVRGRRVRLLGREGWVNYWHGAIFSRTRDTL